MKKLIYALVFLISMALILKGRTINDYKGLMIMVVGLVGLLSELYLYNKKYQ
ncbi:MAG: hypothetical protein RR782_08530 [Clostridium sp.]